MTKKEYMRVDTFNRYEFGYRIIGMRRWLHVKRYGHQE